MPKVYLYAAERASELKVFRELAKAKAYQRRVDPDRIALSRVLSGPSPSKLKKAETWVVVGYNYEEAVVAFFKGAFNKESDGEACAATWNARAEAAGEECELGICSFSCMKVE